MGSASISRLKSLDTFRGIVMVLLIFGGMTVRDMHALHPDQTVWEALSVAFSHAEWQGCSLWDLIMPAFLFMVGLSIPYAYASKRAQGESEAWIFTHAALRALTLLILHLTISVPFRTNLDLAWPFIVMAVGLPVPRWIARQFFAGSPHGVAWLRAAWWGGILGAATFRAIARLYDIPSLEFHDILPALGFAYFFAFLLVKQTQSTRAIIGGLILFAYWLLFATYPLPPADFDPASVGRLPGDPAYAGFFEHWNKGTNAAAAFDRWFLNLWPRPEPYAFNSHGYQTLSFIPEIATIVLGLMAGDAIRTGTDRRSTGRLLFTSGALCVVAGFALGQIAAPIVKSVWTPSWTLFSGGWAILTAAVLHHIIDVRGWTRWADPLVTIGMNPLVLYVIAIEYRWYVLEAWRRLFGQEIFVVGWQPIAESSAFLLSLWFLAAALRRAGIYVRL